MEFVSRTQWGARKPASVLSTDIRPVGVTIHWEGPPMGTFPHAYCPAKVRNIQAYHMETQGWATIAYSAIVCPHGYVFEGRGIGKRSAANGTDAGNDSWYALCALVGKGDVITPDLLRGLDDGIRWLRAYGGAGPRVNGHRDHKATDCPGDALYRWAHGPHPTAATPTPPLPVPAPAPTEETVDMLVIQYGRSVYRLITGDRLIPISAEFATKCKEAGVKAIGLGASGKADLDRLTVGLRFEGEPLPDEEA